MQKCIFPIIILIFIKLTESERNDKFGKLEQINTDRQKKMCACEYVHMYV